MHTENYLTEAGRPAPDRPETTLAEDLSAAMLEVRDIVTFLTDGVLALGANLHCTGVADKHPDLGRGLLAVTNDLHSLRYMVAELEAVRAKAIGQEDGR